MALLSEIYNVTLKRNNRGAAKDGWTRPTIGECSVTHKDFKEVSRLLTPFFGTKCTGGVQKIYLPCEVFQQESTLGLTDSLSDPNLKI